MSVGVGDADGSLALILFKQRCPVQRSSVFVPRTCFHFGHPYPVTRPVALNPRSRVLIVDDQSAIRRALHREFEPAGWDVCGSAANGSEAIAKTEQLLPELAILDLAMPEMNGLTTARILKRTFPEIQVILFTGHGDLFQQEEAMAAGIFCSKTEPIKNLLEKVLSNTSFATDAANPQKRSGIRRVSSLSTWKPKAQ